MAKGVTGMGRASLKRNAIGLQVFGNQSADSSFNNGVGISGVTKQRILDERAAARAKDPLTPETEAKLGPALKELFGYFSIKPQSLAEKTNAALQADAQAIADENLRLATKILTGDLITAPKVSLPFTVSASGIDSFKTGKTPLSDVVTNTAGKAMISVITAHIEAIDGWNNRERRTPYVKPELR